MTFKKQMQDRHQVRTRTRTKAYTKVWLRHTNQDMKEVVGLIMLSRLKQLVMSIPVNTQIKNIQTKTAECEAVNYMKIFAEEKAIILK
ncbi:hypothetical protein ACTXT7_007540 [Hymenolepis weldensis]